MARRWPLLFVALCACFSIPVMAGVATAVVGRNTVVVSKSLNVSRQVGQLVSVAQRTQSIIRHANENFKTSRYHFASASKTSLRFVATNTVAGHSLEDLVTAGEAADRYGPSAAGRPLQKHGAREGSVFPEVVGGPNAANRAHRDVLEGIITDPLVSEPCGSLWTF